MAVGVEERTPRGSAPVPGRPEPVVTRLVRTMPVLIFAALVFLVAKISAEPVANPDTFFHLRFGSEFLGTWSPWHPGTVTRFATAHWVPTQWLGEILMAATAKAFGLPGVAWLTGAMFLAFTTAVYASCRQVAGNGASVAMTAIAVVAAGDGLSGRPQVLSYLLVVVTAEAWRRTSRDARPRWWLLGVAWVWPMLHGMWPLGIVVSAVAAVGIVVDRRATITRADVRRLLGLPVLMAVVSALTPIGPKIYPAVLLVSARGRYYTEWQSPDFHRLPQIALLILLAVVAVLRIRQGSTSWYFLAGFAVAAGFCVYSGRTVPVAAGLLAPMAAAAIGDATGRAEGTRRRDLRVAVGVVLAGLAVLAAVVPFTAARPAAKPAWLDQELSALPAGTAVLNDDYLGGYLMWRYPDLQPYAHGYGDAFTTAELQQSRSLVQLDPGWPETLRATGIGYAVLNPRSALAYELVRFQGWRMVHSTGQYAWLVAPRP